MSTNAHSLVNRFVCITHAFSLFYVFMVCMYVCLCILLIEFVSSLIPLLLSFILFATNNMLHTTVGE